MPLPKKLLEKWNKILKVSREKKQHKVSFTFTCKCGFYTRDIQTMEEHKEWHKYNDSDLNE